MVELGFGEYQVKFMQILLALFDCQLACVVLLLARLLLLLAFLRFEANFGFVLFPS